MRLKSLHQPSIWLYRVMAGGGFIDMSGDSIAESSAHGYSYAESPHRNDYIKTSLSHLFGFLKL